MKPIFGQLTVLVYNGDVTELCITELCVGFPRRKPFFRDLQGFYAALCENVELLLALSECVD